jgi:Ca2+-dependent lipid-binding protein
MDATLQLMLYRASQLPSTERTSKIDAYVKVVAGAQTIKSAVVQDNDNPVVRAARPARCQRAAAWSCIKCGKQAA